MMTFRVRLRNTKRLTQARLSFDLEKLRNLDVADTFQASVGGKLSPLFNLRYNDMDIDSIITIYITAVTDIARRNVARKRDLKNRRYEEDGAKE